VQENKSNAKSVASLLRNIFGKIPALAFRSAEHKSEWFHSSRGPKDFV
jgi:hypothetical protein